MLATLQKLAALLARDPLTTNEVIEHLGKVTHDYGVNVVLAPSDPSFKEASVVNGIDHATRKPSGTPAHVVLVPSDPPTIESLAKTFGAYTRIPAEDKIPEQVIFYLDLPGQPYTAALIAEVRQDRATRITLRRDKRT